MIFNFVIKFTTELVAANILIKLKDIPENLLKPDIASLPVGLFSTPTKLPWYHECIYPLPTDLFSVPTSLQTLPTHYSASNSLKFVYNFQKLHDIQESGVILKISQFGNEKFDHLQIIFLF
jgi:hypothetical protein